MTRRNRQCPSPAAPRPAGLAGPECGTSMGAAIRAGRLSLALLFASVLIVLGPSQLGSDPVRHAGRHHPRRLRHHPAHHDGDAESCAQRRRVEQRERDRRPQRHGQPRRPGRQGDQLHADRRADRRERRPRRQRLGHDHRRGPDDALLRRHRHRRQQGDGQDHHRPHRQDQTHPPRRSYHQSERRRLVQQGRDRRLGLQR